MECVAAKLLLVTLVSFNLSSLYSDTFWTFLTPLIPIAMPVLLKIIPRQASLRLWHQLREALEAARSCELRPSCRQTCSGATFCFRAGLALWGSSYFTWPSEQKFKYNKTLHELFKVFPSLALEELPPSSFPTHLGEGKRTCRHLCHTAPLFSWRSKEEKTESLSVGTASIQQRRKFWYLNFLKVL